MQDLQRTVTLSGGATVTVEAWPFGYVMANSADFFAVLEFCTQVMRGEIDVLSGYGAQHGALLTRVIEQSLSRPADTQLLKVSDVPDILEAIFELNGLEELIKKSLRLRERQLLAATSLPGLSATSSPS